MNEIGQSFDRREIIQQEVQVNVKKLVDLSEKVDLTDPDVTDLLAKTESISLEAEGVQKRTIEELTRIDRKGTGVIVQKLQKLSGYVSQARTNGISSFSQDDLIQHHDADEILQRYLQSSSDRQVPSPLQALVSKRRRAFGAEDQGDTIIKLCNSPQVVWNELLHEGIITKEYLDNFEQVMAFVEMSQKWELLQANSDRFSPDQIRAIRAKVFVPYADLINPVLIEEIIEGHFDMGKDFEQGALSMFTQIAEGRTSKKPGLTFRQKAVRIAAAAAIAVISAGASEAIRDDDQPEPPGKTLKLEADSEDEDEDKSLDSGEGDITIKNENAEDFKKGQKTVDFELKGDNLAGLYKTGTADLLVKNRRGYAWRLDGLPMTGGIPSDVKSKQKNGIEVTAYYDKYPYKVALPEKYGNKINPDSFTFTVDGKSAEPYDFRLWYNRLSMQWNDDFRKHEVKVGYSLAEAAEPVSSSYLGYLVKAEFAPLSALSGKDFQRFVRISSENTTDLEKVREFEKWIKYDFVYSLNPSYSDFYQKAPTSKEFISRLFRKKYADCDVANTAFLFLVRSANMPSRMAYGYNNGESFLLNKDKNQLVAGERHGWIEVFLNGKWVPFDATPVKMDDKAAEALKDSDFPEIPDPESKLPGNLDEWSLKLESLKDLFQAEADYVGLGPDSEIALGLGFLYAFFAYKFYRRVQGLKEKSAEAREDVRYVIERIPFSQKPSEKDLDYLVKVFDQYEARERAILKHDKSFLKYLVRYRGNLDPFVPFLRGRFYRPFEKRYKGSSKRAAEVQNGLDAKSLDANPTYLDPVDLFIEIGGYDTEKIKKEVGNKNLNVILRQFESSLVLGDFFLSDQDFERDNGVLDRALSVEMIGKKGFETYPDSGKLVIQEKLLEALTLEQYIEKLVTKGKEAYRREAERRKSANHNDRAKDRSWLPELSLSDEEVESILRDETLQPFIAMWHLVNS